MKTSAIKSDNHKIILDDNRSFQKWHTKLKGGLSNYEKDRIARNATSCYRKTSAELQQILLLVINKNNQTYLDIHKQGRNSDGSTRNVKYMLNIEQAHHFEVGKINF